MSIFCFLGKILCLLRKLTYRAKDGDERSSRYEYAFLLTFLCLRFLLQELVRMTVPFSECILDFVFRSPTEGKFVYIRIVYLFIF